MASHSNQHHLEISDLELRIQDRLLCRPFSVSMKPGETWAILGPNGSGKTTLLTTLAGLRAPDSGDIRLDGASICTANTRQLAQWRSMLFQNTEDHFPSSVLETVLTGRHPHIPAFSSVSGHDMEIVYRAIEKTDLQGFEERDILTLSGGERQRVSIAACLAQDTPIRLFDEPANHLDLKHQGMILQLISDPRHLNIVVLQDVNQAWRYATHTVLLHAGGDVDCGPVKDLLTVDRLEALYGCNLKSVSSAGQQYFIHA